MAGKASWHWDLQLWPLLGLLPRPSSYGEWSTRACHLLPGTDRTAVTHTPGRPDYLEGNAPSFDLLLSECFSPQGQEGQCHSTPRSHGGEVPIPGGDFPFARLTHHRLPSETTAPRGVCRVGEGRGCGGRMWVARRPSPRGGFTVTSGRFLRTWGRAARASRQPKCACRARSDRPTDRPTAKASPGLAESTGPHSARRRVLSRHHPWDGNKSRLGDIWLPLHRNSRLPRTHCPETRARLQIHHTHRSTLLRGEPGRPGPLINFKTRPVPATRPRAGTPLLPDS